MKSKRLIFIAMASALTASAEVPEKADTLMLEPVVFSETGKTKIDLLPLTTTVVTSQQIRQSAEASLLPVLSSRVPGMFFTERGVAGFGASTGSAGAVNIRGVGQSNKVLFMIDGQPQWAGIFGHALPDTYVANGVDHVEIVRGPSSLLYGSNAMGGSVNIITRSVSEDGFRGRANAMLGSYLIQRYAATAAYKKGKWSASAGVTFDGSKGSRPSSHYWLANEYAQIDYAASSHWEVGANLHTTQTKAYNPGEESNPWISMWSRVYRGTVAVYANDRYEHTRGGVQAYLNWGANKVDDGYHEGGTPRNYWYMSTDYNAGLTMYQTVNPWKGNDLSLGFDLQQWGGHHWNKLKADGTIAEGSDFKEHVTEVAGYVMMQQAFWDDLLSINAGVRLQHGSQYGNEWVPQAGFILKPFKGNSLKFSFGKGFRAPNLRELYLYPPKNPDLKPEYLYNYEVELRQRLLDNKLNLGLSLYFIDGRDMIQTQMVDGKPRNMNVGRFINKGFEVDATYYIDSRWQLYLGYAYLHTDAKILAAPKNKVDAEVTFSPGRWRFTLQSETIGGLYTSIGDNAKVQNYTLLNFRGSYKFATKLPITLYAKIENFTNRHYEINEGFPMPGITAMGGVEIEF